MGNNNASTKSISSQNWVIAQLEKCDNGNEHYDLQKQPTRGVLRKICSENKQQIYSKRPIPKCDFNMLTSTWVFSCKHAVHFQNTFS